MLKKLYIDKGFTILHSITKEGGAGKSKFNNADKTIKERIDHNFSNTAKGLATSIITQANNQIQKFGPLGLILTDGEINNVNHSDAGSNYNDNTDRWETTEGINNPSINQVSNEMQKAKSYSELNIYNYKIGGFFLDFDEQDWLATTLDNSLSDFYNYTKKYELPYYGFIQGQIIRIDTTHLANNDWVRVSGGTLVKLDDLYYDN